MGKLNAMIFITVDELSAVPARTHNDIRCWSVTVKQGALRHGTRRAYKCV